MILTVTLILVTSFLPTLMVANKNIAFKTVDNISLVSSTLRILWTQNGIPICSAAEDQYDPKICSDGEGGISFTAGTEISCRWEGKQMKYIASTGEVAISRANVFTSQDVSLKGYLFLGELTDLDSGSIVDPTLEHEAYEIKAFNKVPSIKGAQFERVAIL